MRAIILLLCSFVIMSCTSATQSVEVKETKKPEPVVQPWPEDKKNFWITLYFTRMSHDPTIRLRFPPENLYNVCKCILDIVSTDFEFDDFLQKFNKSPLMDEHRQYIYDLSTKCSNEEVMLLRQQSIDKLDLQNSI